jgi:hypothetical protein
VSQSEEERGGERIIVTTTATEASCVLMSVQTQRNVGSLDQLKKVLIARTNPLGASLCLETSTYQNGL